MVPIDKFHIYTDNMTFLNYDKGEPDYTFEILNIYDLVESPIPKGNQMKDLLIECESQLREYLTTGLISMAMLRNTGLVHLC